MGGGKETVEGRPNQRHRPVGIHVLNDTVNMILDPETGSLQPIAGPDGIVEVVFSRDNSLAYYTTETLESHIWLLQFEEGGR